MGIRTMALLIARVVTAAWVGAAVLFVITSVREVSHPEIDTATRNLLPGIRFPAYYATGIILMGAGLLSASLAAGHPQLSRWRRRTTVALLSLAFVCMCVDYVWIYSPLLAVLSAESMVKPSEFVGYHRASEMINGFELVLVLVAAGLLSLAPERPVPSPES